MAKQERMRVRLVTDAGRLSFPNLAEPRTEMADGTKFPSPRWDATILIPPDAEGLPALKKAIGDILVDTFGPDWRSTHGDILTRGRVPLKPVDTSKAYYGDEFEGWFALAASNMQQAPGLVDESRQPVLNARDVYAGCWARFQITLYPYNKAGNRGVSAALDNVQKVADGDRFGGGTESAASAFDGVGVKLPPEAEGADSFGSGTATHADPSDIF